MPNVEEIRGRARERNIRWTAHALRRMDERDIQIADCMRCLLEGEIIEEYPTDYPYPSCLMMEPGKPLHLVCSMGEGCLFVITAYVPDTDEWFPDWKRRIKP